MKRIWIVGQTGAGKTTLAQTLAERLSLSHTELDALHWQADWTPLTPAAFRARVEQVLGADAWIVDGNYSAVSDLVAARADTLVWLDYNLATIFKQLSVRTLRRVFLREALWNGNRETFRGQFLSRESLFVWALKTRRKYKRRYGALVGDPRQSHKVVHLRSPQEMRWWLEHLS